jgi:adenylate cyclase
MSLWRSRYAFGAIASLLAALLAGGAFHWRPITTLDRLIYDSRLRYQTAPMDQRLVIVDIDEKSLAQIGRWPWSRATMAKLIDQLKEAKTVSIDILFAEPQDQPELTILRQMQQDPQLAVLAPKLKALGDANDADLLLAKSLTARPTALGYYLSNDRDGRTTGQLPEPLFESAALRGKGWQLSNWDGFSANLSPVAGSGSLAGFFNPKFDDDGVLRELVLLGDFRGKTYESLAVASLRSYLGSGANAAPLGLDANGLVVSKLRIPATDQMTVLVPFAGAGGPKGGRFQYLSASDVLAGKIDKRLLQNKLVLIGTSTVGLTDLRATPVSAVYPGVEVHASLISGALEGSIKTHPPGAGWLAALFTLLLGTILTATMPRVAALGVVSIAALAGLSLVSFYSIAYSGMGWVVSIAPALLLVPLLAGYFAVSGYFFEGRKRAQISERFGEYVAPQVVQRMLENPEQFTAKSENRELSILFTDIRGFTRNAETMQPEALHEYINCFLTSMTDVILSYHGTVDKYMGDAVMAFWGAPLTDAHHADHAVACAFAMQQEAARLNREFHEKGLPELTIGIGINTGRVLVGDMGSKRRRTYTAIGDAVNLAARLEQLTKQFDAKIIVGESTAKAAKGHSFRELGSVLVSGRMESAIIFEPKALLGAEIDSHPVASPHAFTAPLGSTALRLPLAMEKAA